MNKPASPARALIAMSGGVDSSAAAALMLEEGNTCTGITFRLFGDNTADIDDARETSRKLGIPHRVLDLSGPFRDKVILPFIGTYEAGATPNPCVYCNRFIKFNFSSLAAVLDFDLYATGHYARVTRAGSRMLLKKAADPLKDQSYVLFSLGQEILSRVRFPLGNLSKTGAREIARERGLANADRRDSQDICFVPGGDYGAFMESYTGKTYPPGDILSTDGKIMGRHKGHVRYTLGQRRGLGVAANEPVYVCAKDTARNTITLGPESALRSRRLTAANINLIACDSLEKPLRVSVKTRYLQKEHPAWVIQTGPDEIRVDFDEDQRALTPGQAAVLYDGDIVVGGGYITSSA